MNTDIAEIVVKYLVFVFSTTCHEAAHAYFAYRGGDPTAYLGGHVTLDPIPHIKRSPLTYVANVKTPTMLMTGVQDLRTPMPQTEQFYSALKLLKVPTAMLRFNNEWHGTSSTPSNFVRTQLYLRYLFDKYKRGQTATTTSAPQQ